MKCGGRISFPNITGDITIIAVIYSIYNFTGARLWIYVHPIVTIDHMGLIFRARLFRPFTFPLFLRVAILFEVTKSAAEAALRLSSKATFLGRMVSSSANLTFLLRFSSRSFFIWNHHFPLFASIGSRLGII